jgi:hypothetical protein
MATGKQLKAPILTGRAVKGPRKKRTRPEPRQYTLADLERARDRVAAAERRIDNDHSSNANRGSAGLERAQLDCPSSSRNYARAASSSDGSIELAPHPGERVEGPRSRLACPTEKMQRVKVRRRCRRCAARRHQLTITATDQPAPLP